MVCRWSAIGENRPMHIEDFLEKQPERCPEIDVQVAEDLTRCCAMISYIELCSTLARLFPIGVTIDTHLFVSVIAANEE